MSAQRADAPIPSWHPWRDRAACRDLDTALFFPAGEGEASTEQVQAAKAVCETCAVKAECLAFALATRQESGVWGGLTEEERRRHRRRLARERRKAS